jgi:DNA-binding response OmpR family regulator
MQSTQDYKAKLLVVEDDTNLAMVIKDYLSLSGYKVILCNNGISAWENFNSENPDLCILDIMLPDKDGFELTESIRIKNDKIPILFLTARSTPEDKIKGFKLGADDYITKPFNIEELVMRIEVFLKRTSTNCIIKNACCLGNYIFDYENMELNINNQQYKLTRREADVLNYLIKHKNQVVRREELLTNLWGENDYFLGRSLDVFIFKLRKYLNSDKKIRIVNYHSIGFKLEIKTSQ